MAKILVPLASGFEEIEAVSIIDVVRRSKIEVVIASIVQNMLKYMKKEKIVAAICAAPYALHKAGVLNYNYTCYPSVEEKITLDGYNDSSSVLVDGNVITSRGPGTAICFALEIVKILKGDKTYEELKQGLLANYCS